MRKTLTLVLAFLFLAPALSVFAADGETLYKTKGCTSCHGVEGAKTIVPTYPTLAGQNEKYLALQLKEFKSGKRTGSQAGLMKPFAISLSDKDINALAKYLSGVKKK